MNEYTLNHKLDKFMADIPPSLFNDLSLPINFVDHHCNILVMNKAFLEYLELPLKDVVGQNLVDIDNTTRFPIVLQTGIPEIAQKHRFKNGKEAIVDRIPIYDGDRIIGAAGLIFFDDLPPDSIENKIRQSIIEKIRPEYRINKTLQHTTLKASYNFDDIISNSKHSLHMLSTTQAPVQTNPLSVSIVPPFQIP